MAACVLLSAGATASASPPAAAADQVLFEQPPTGLAVDGLVVPPATHVPPPAGRFNLVLWQPNPRRPDGSMVPTGWAAGTRTGFFPRAPVPGSQLGFEDRPGTSTVQMEGGTVGVFLDSGDLPPDTHKQKMMITPSFRFRRGEEPEVFALPGATLAVAMELQVPTARDAHRAGSETYIVADLLFRGPRGEAVSYGTVLFFNGVPRSRVQIAVDEDTHSLMVNSPLGEDERFVGRLGPGPGKLSIPWRGWRRFAFGISRAQFAAALRELAERVPGATPDADPATYRLVQVHLNAELHFGTGPAQLGWSMRRMKVWVEQAGSGKVG